MAQYSPILTILVSALLGWYILHVFKTSPVGALAGLDLNNHNLIFVTAGLLLHWRPRQFIRAVSESIPATEGVIIQFPFYAVIFGMIVGTGLSDRLAKLILSVSSSGSFPILVAAYSAALGVFIPSGGSKWIIEGPLRAPSSGYAPRSSRVGGADLQCIGGPPQPDQSVLDAALAWHTQIEGEGHCRVWGTSVDGARASCVFLVLVFRATHCLRPTSKIVGPKIRACRLRQARCGFDLGFGDAGYGSLQDIEARLPSTSSRVGALGARGKNGRGVRNAPRDRGFTAFQ